MRAHKVAITVMVVAAVGGGAAACNSLLGIHGGTARPAVTQLSAGAAFACALLADGSVWCWGADDHQQLGHQDLDADVPCKWAAPEGGTNVGLCNPKPTQVLGLAGVTQIAVGNDFACALLGTGEVDCWGSNDQGQLGPLGAGDFAYSNCPLPYFEGGTLQGVVQCTPVPKVVTGIPPATAITAGGLHACASTDGGVYCWGSNSTGLLDSPTAGMGPVRTKDVPAALQLTAPLPEPQNGYGDSTCALISPSSTICWGSDNQYDNGCANPVCKLATEGVTSVHLGEGYGCALGATGTLDCWGLSNFFDFESTNDSVAEKTPTTSDYSQLLSVSFNATATLFDGRSTHVLVVDQKGALYGWGDNTYGQAGTAPAMSNATCNDGYSHCATSPVPIDLEDGGAVTTIATGVGFSLARTSDGTVLAWGTNTEGQLGYVADGGPCVSLEAGAQPCNWVPSPIQVPP
jgi:alpha-tubulin suppressor-like RCC1 family protein